MLCSHARKKNFIRIQIRTISLRAILTRVTICFARRPNTCALRPTSRYSVTCHWATHGYEHRFCEQIKTQLHRLSRDERMRKMGKCVGGAEVFPNIPSWKITSNFNLVHTDTGTLGSFASSEITSGWKWIAEYAKRSVNNYIMYGKHHASGRTLCLKRGLRDADVAVHCVVCVYHRHVRRLDVQCAQWADLMHQEETRTQDVGLLSSWKCHNLHFK